MTGTAKQFTGAPFSGKPSWQSINRKTVGESVRRMQIRIAKAVREGRFGRAKAIRWLLTHSFYGIGIRRYVKIRGDANPSDLKYQEYFNKRKRKKRPGMRYHYIEFAVGSFYKKWPLKCLSRVR
ncbi:reverse transcriptase N-terminal domain-containing protein [Desulfococcaceae bacterium HSG8]|nr:reverse transcriptase N-terminal domain-containing protein [Desulfococcaceae bacterium HSG8]